MNRGSRSDEAVKIVRVTDARGSMFTRARPACVRGARGARLWDGYRAQGGDRT